jgi:hypothetical protein
MREAYGKPKETELSTSGRTLVCSILEADNMQSLVEGQGAGTLKRVTEEAYHGMRSGGSAYQVPGQRRRWPA